MSNAKERKCIIDGIIYKYCPTCSDYNSNEKWRLIYCSENCMNIHSVYNAYKANKISKSEATRKLSNCDLSNYSNVSGFIKEVLDEVINTKKTKVVLDKQLSEEEKINDIDIVNEEL